MGERQIIGIIGAIGSGKDTIADYLIAEHGFKKLSFARRVKDAAAAVFGWDRDLLEGATKESREWREQVDPFWGLSPRLALQKIGTEMFRIHIRDDIWIKGVEKDLAAEPLERFVITDCRFQNEIDTIRRAGGRLIYVERGPRPDWVPRAIKAYNGSEADNQWFADQGIHVTVWSTYALAEQADEIIENNGSLEDLYSSVRSTAVQNYIKKNLNDISIKMYNKKSHHMEDDLESTGKFYGYPTCCIEAFIENGGKIRSKECYMASKKLGQVGFIPCDSCSNKVLTGTVRSEDLISEINSRRSCETPLKIPKEIPLKELEVYGEEAIESRKVYAEEIIERRKQKERFTLG